MIRLPGRVEHDWLDRHLARLLRGGVAIAAVIVLIGGLWYLADVGGERASYGAFVGEPSGLRSVGAILSGLRDPQPRTIIQFGLLVLIGTPVARVVFSVLGFARERDWLYVGITSAVLLLLAVSLWD